MSAVALEDLATVTVSATLSNNSTLQHEPLRRSTFLLLPSPSDRKPSRASSRCLSPSLTDVTQLQQRELPSRPALTLTSPLESSQARSLGLRRSKYRSCPQRRSRTLLPPTPRTLSWSEASRNGCSPPKNYYFHPASSMACQSRKSWPTDKKASIS